jgi:primosomal protein N' (replication factor Y)
VIAQVAVPIPGVWAYDYQVPAGWVLVRSDGAAQESIAEENRAVAVAPSSPEPCQESFLALPEQPEKPAPLASGEEVGVGSLVRVAIGPRQVVGVVLGFTADSDVDGKRLKSLRAVLPSRVPGSVLALVLWGSRYYRVGPGQFLQGVIPAAIRKGQRPSSTRVLEINAGFTRHESLTQRQQEVFNVLTEHTGMTVTEAKKTARCSDALLKKLLHVGAVQLREQDDDREFRMRTKPEDFPLNDEQKQAVDTIAPLIRHGKPEVFCLFGVTGSGKTLVFRELALAARAAGKQVVILLPEIGLTPQAAARYRHTLPDLVVWHSGFSDGQRALAWQRVSDGASCVLGTRSALFAPLQNIGLIIVDEEHDGSYKQEGVPRYHARDMAVMYGRQLKVPVVLGSATPALETYANVQSKRYRLLRLLKRPAGARLPTATVIDMAEVFRREGKQVAVAPELLEALRETKANGEQAIILLNRRGWAPQAVCCSCGTAIQCPKCAVTLTFHKKVQQLRCHYCEYQKPFDPTCPSCGQPDIATRGIGTEQLADLLAKRVPGLRVRRLDADVAGGREAHVQLLSDFAAGTADCLVGTQMVAKGLDFPNVTLVGLVAADAALAVPDFRAAERCYQLVAQVAGRAGRGQRPGRVIVQAFDTEAPAIQCALAGQARPFYREQMRLRDMYGYPPHGALVRLLWRGSSLSAVAQTAEQAVTALRKVGLEERLHILGPSEAGMPYLQGEHRWHCLVKGRDRRQLQRVLDAAAQGSVFQVRSGVSLTIDVDPMAIT